METIFGSAESPFIRYWRPAMAWIYATICIFDFLVGPILFMILQGEAVSMAQWTPMTLRSGGIFHIAMGAIVAAVGWGRTQEKLRYMDYVNSIGSIRNSINNGGDYSAVEDEETDPVEEEPVRKPHYRRKAIVQKTEDEPIDETTENDDTIVKKVKKEPEEK